MPFYPGPLSRITIRECVRTESRGSPPSQRTCMYRQAPPNSPPTSSPRVLQLCSRADQALEVAVLVVQLQRARIGDRPARLDVRTRDDLLHGDLDLLVVHGILHRKQRNKKAIQRRRRCRRRHRRRIAVCRGRRRRTGISSTSKMYFGTCRALSAFRIASRIACSTSPVSLCPARILMNRSTRSSVSAGRRCPTHIESSISAENRSSTV